MLGFFMLNHLIDMKTHCTSFPIKFSNIFISQMGLGNSKTKRQKTQKLHRTKKSKNLKAHHPSTPTHSAPTSHHSAPTSHHSTPTSTSSYPPPSYHPTPPSPYTLKNSSISSDSTTFSTSYSGSSSYTSSSSSSSPTSPIPPPPTPTKDQQSFKLITDNYKSYSDLERGLRAAGLEASQLIVGIDFTKSNEWQGGPPYYVHENLHQLDPQHLNPYQQVLKIMCQSLAPFDADQYIDAYGFGDSETRNKSVFSFQTNPLDGNSDQPCYKLEGVLEEYTKIVPHLAFSGPTSFAPIIRKAIQLVKERHEYHILLIIADGAVNDKWDTIDAIVEASKYALSIVCIGVGRGPWDIMEEFDDEVPDRDFDNFQFVDFYKILRKCENQEVEFAKHALMEIPEQYTYINKFILKKT